MREGVRAEYVQPVFPSNSFPSWTSIATGYDKVGADLCDKMT